MPSHQASHSHHAKIFHFNLAIAIFDAMSMLAKVAYVLAGLFATYPAIISTRLTKQYAFLFAKKSPTRRRFFVPLPAKHLLPHAVLVEKFLIFLIHRQNVFL